MATFIGLPRKIYFSSPSEPNMRIKNVSLQLQFAAYELAEVFHGSNLLPWFIRASRGVLRGALITLHCTPDTREGPDRHAPVHRAIQFSNPTVRAMFARWPKPQNQDCTRPTRRWIKSATGTAKAIPAVQPSHRRLQALEGPHSVANNEHSKSWCYR
jgi:hypothetical protein